MICLQYFFPQEPVEHEHPSVEQMRTAIVRLVIGHIIVAILSLGLVSFVTAFMQFLYFAMLYSLYLTLKNWLVWLYIGCLALNVISGVFEIWLF